MKTKICVIITSILFFTSTQLTAVPEDKIFTSSGQILPGEEWSNVYIYNDDTIVDMLGGLVDSIGAYNASMVNITGGTVYTLDALELSIANISKGSVGIAHAGDHAVVNFSGDASAVRLGAGSDFGTVNMSSGFTQYIGAGDSGTINLYGGVIAENLGAVDSAIVNIYGYGNYDPTAGNFDGGQLTGFWLDDTPFTIDLYGVETYSHINLVPEPCSLILLAFGGLVMMRKR
jgi:hypothetical protein